MVFWFWLGVAILTVPPVAYGLVMAALYLYVRWKYMGFLTRIFQEKPLFVVPRGEPRPDAEDVTVPRPTGWRSAAATSAPPRRSAAGVILFGLEFGSNRWACRQYCQKLIDAGYDVFAVEPRNQGESDQDPNYEPLQWVTDRDVADMRAAVTYLLAPPGRRPAAASASSASARAAARACSSPRPTRGCAAW